MAKFTKTLLLLLGGMMMFTMASCLNDDDYESSTNLTPEEVARYLQQMGGTASGKTYLLYLGKSQLGLDSLAEDSVMNTGVNIIAADSTLRMNFPLKLIAHAVEFNDALKEALTNAGDLIINAKLVPYRADDSEQLLGFYMIPQDATGTNITYADGKTHKVQLQFNGSGSIGGINFSSVGGYAPSTRQLSFYMIPYKLSLDDKATVTLRSNVIMFNGAK